MCISSEKMEAIEVEITDEMIQAGLYELFCYDQGTGKVFRFHQARIPRDGPGTEGPITATRTPHAASDRKEPGSY